MYLSTRRLSRPASGQWSLYVCLVDVMPARWGDVSGGAVLHRVDVNRVLHHLGFQSIV